MVTIVTLTERVTQQICNTLNVGVKSAVSAQPGTYGGLRGCLQLLELDGRKIGLPDVLETSGIQATCVWQYPCLAKNSPCVEGSVCFQQGTSGFKCDCDWPVCVKDQQHPGQNLPPINQPVKVK